MNKKRFCILLVLVILFWKSGEIQAWINGRWDRSREATIEAQKARQAITTKEADKDMDEVLDGFKRPLDRREGRR